MHQLRSIGAFTLACSLICFIIAFERYQSAVRSAKAIAAAIDGVEFESTRLPTVSVVAGLAGVALLVAGVRLLFESRRAHKAENMSDEQNLIG